MKLKNPNACNSFSKMHQCNVDDQGNKRCGETGPRYGFHSKFNFGLD